MKRIVLLTLCAILALTNVANAQRQAPDISPCYPLVDAAGLPPQYRDHLVRDTQAGQNFTEFVCGLIVTLGERAISVAEAPDGRLMLKVNAAELYFVPGYYDKANQTFLAIKTPNGIPSLYLTELVSNGQRRTFVSEFQSGSFVINTMAEYYTPLQVFLTSR